VLFFIIIRILHDPQCIELFTSNKKAKVPWSALVKEEDFLEDDERIPSDPSKLRYSEVVDLWEVFTVPHVFLASPRGIARTPHGVRMESVLVRAESTLVRADYLVANLAWVPV
jgi:hypothetical protein